MELTRSLFSNLRASRSLRSSPRALSPKLAAHHRPLWNASAPLLRNQLRSARPAVAPALLNNPFQRFNCTSSTSDPPSDSLEPPSNEQQLERRDVPAYELTFTCKPCLTRATHRISKQGYHKGTVLITCPNCKARHLIADHLKIFEDKSTTIEDILREKGDVLKKGTLGDQADIEIWDDGTVTQRNT